MDGAGHDDGEGASLVAGEGADGHGQGAFVAEPPQDVCDGRIGLRLPSVVPAVQSADEGEQEFHGLHAPLPVGRLRPVERFGGHVLHPPDVVPHHRASEEADGPVRGEVRTFPADGGDEHDVPQGEEFPHAHGEDDGVPRIVFRLAVGVEGPDPSPDGSFEPLARDFPPIVPLPRACELLGGLFDGHGCGVVHRRASLNPAGP